jgi:hypothetical protein
MAPEFRSTAFRRNLEMLGLPETLCSWGGSIVRIPPEGGTRKPFFSSPLQREWIAVLHLSNLFRAFAFAEILNDPNAVFCLRR